jgi:hypothetical protein
MCVYVAGPLNGTAVEYIKNVGRMCREALSVLAKGHSPFVPCLDLLLGILHGGMEYEEYAESNLLWVAKADVVYALGRSPGTDREIAYAAGHGVPVVWCIDQLADFEWNPYRHQWTLREKADG